MILLSKKLLAAVHYPVFFNTFALLIRCIVYLNTFNPVRVVFKNIPLTLNNQFYSESESKYDSKSNE